MSGASLLPFLGLYAWLQGSRLASDTRVISLKMHNKLFWRKYLESYLSLCCCLFLLASFKMLYYIYKYCSKRILVSCTLFRLKPYAVIRVFLVFIVECILKCATYSVIRAYSVSDFDKCTTLFHYFSLLCYLELRSRPWWVKLMGTAVTQLHVLVTDFSCVYVFWDTWFWAFCYKKWFHLMITHRVL